MESKPQQKLIWSWAFYDWANSAFATTVMAGFFPLFFKQYWSADFSVTESTSILGLATSISSFLLALASPALGAVADQGAWRKKFLFAFTLIGALGSLALGFIAKGDWLTAVIMYSIASIGFTGALTFYDAFLVQIAPLRSLDRVSGLGYALGYLGGGLLFAVNVWMYLKPEFFGLADGVAGVKAAFVTVGVWWLVFSLPLFLWVPEVKSLRPARPLQIVSQGFHTLWHHLRELKKERSLMFFLIGYLFYIDGVNTIARMAVDYGMSIGLEAADLIKALLLVQFIAFPSAVIFGRIGESFSPKKGIWFCLIVYTLVTVFAYGLSTSTQFFAMAALIGVVQGGIQALSRSYYARLVPPAQAAQYFGFFNMIGKFSSILGPLFVASVGYWRNDPRSGILVLVVFFLVGGFFLSRSQKVAEGTP